MKRLLIAAAVFSLAGAGVALAQAGPSSPSNSDQSSTAPQGSMAPSPDTASPPAAASNGATSSPDSMSPGVSSNAQKQPPSANDGAMVGDQTGSNPAPTTYPRCTHKGQDRCRAKGG